MSTQTSLDIIAETERLSAENALLEAQLKNEGLRKAYQEHQILLPALLSPAKTEAPVVQIVNSIPRLRGGH